MTHRDSRIIYTDTIYTGIILAFDTAGSACSIAIGRGAAVLAHHRTAMRHGHAEALLPMVDATMREASIAAAELNALAVSVGPGGFTGIRVGLAAAHGIALATRIPLIGITSFAAVAAVLPRKATHAAGNNAAILVALDSRRADLYVQLLDTAGAPLGEPRAILPEDLGDLVAAAAGAAPLVIAGDAADSAATALSGRTGMTIVPASAPDARGVLAAARRALASGEPTAPARPLYLRPADVTAPKPPLPLPPLAASRRITPLPPSASVPLAILHRACFPDDPWDAAALARVMGLSGCFGYIDWEGENPTGFVLVRDLGDECEILSIGVAPASRRRGIGANLMRRVLAETRRRRMVSVVLEVAADNRPARRLYTGLGFARVGHRPRYYRRRDGMADALIMRLTLVDTATSR